MENLEEKQPQSAQPQPTGEKPIPQPTPQEVSQPQTPEPKPKKSFLLPIFLPLVILLLGGGLVFAYFTFLRPRKVAPQPAASPIPSPSASPDLTAEWESYTNGEHSFSLRYPKDWQADEKQVPDTSIVVTFTKEDFELDLGYGIEIDVRENPQELSSSEWAEAEAKSTGGDVPDLKSKETTVAGVKTFVFSGPLPRWTKEVIYLPYKEKIYIIRAFNNVAKESIVKDLKNTFNLMLQTFKFIDDETAEWESYVNTEYNYSVKYPAEMRLFEVGETTTTSSESWQDAGLDTSSIAVHLLAYENSGGLSSQEYAEKNAPKFDLYGKKALKVGGKAAYQYSFADTTRDKSFPTRTTTVAYEGNVIVIVGINKLGQVDFDTYDRMLQTFKFTE